VIDNQLVTVPAAGGVVVPTTAPRGLRLVVNLSDADKLAVGKILDLSSFFSFDGGATWQFVDGINWTSYGPAGLTVTDPDGTVRVNPDPALGVPLNNQTGQLMRLTYQAVGISTAGVQLFGIS